MSSGPSTQGTSTLESTPSLPPPPQMGPAPATATATATTPPPPPPPPSTATAGRTFYLPASSTEIYLAGYQPPPAPLGKDEHQQQTATAGNTANNTTNTLVILLTNSLGISSKNNRALADRFAEKLGCLVAMPDLFEDDPVTTGGAVLHDDEEEENSYNDNRRENKYENEELIGHADANTNTSATTSAATGAGAGAGATSATGATANTNKHKKSLLSLVKTFAISTVKGFLEDMWTAKHTFDHTLPILETTVTELLTVYQPQKVAVVGYSFGAKYVLHLLNEGPALPEGPASRWASAAEDLTTRGQQGPTTTTTTSAAIPNLYKKIVCGAVIHPSLLEPSDFENVIKPVHLVYAKDDDLLPESIVRKGLQLLDDRNKSLAGDVETTVYDNQVERANYGAQPLPHGFAVPGDYPSSIVGDRADQVFNVVTAWVSEHL